MRPSISSGLVPATISRFLVSTWSDEAIAVGGLAVVFDTSVIGQTFLDRLELTPASKESAARDAFSSVTGFPSGMMSLESKKEIKLASPKFFIQNTDSSCL